MYIDSIDLCFIPTDCVDQRLLWSTKSFALWSIPRAYSSDQKTLNHLIGQVPCVQAVLDPRSSRPQDSRSRVQDFKSVQSLHITDKVDYCSRTPKVSTLVNHDSSCVPWVLRNREGVRVEHLYTHSEYLWVRGEWLSCSSYSPLFIEFITSRIKLLSSLLI